MVELSLVFPLVVVAAVVLFAVARRGAFRAVAVAAENCQPRSRHHDIFGVEASLRPSLFFCLVQCSGAIYSSPFVRRVRRR